MKDLLRVLMTPHCWIRVGYRDKAWNKVVNEGLKDPTFSKVSEHRCLFNGMTVWIANHPYASCSRISDDMEPDTGLPNRGTAIRFMNAYRKYLSKETSNGNMGNRS